MAQGVHENVRIVPAVEAEGHLLQVGRKMLDADFVPRSHDAPFQERECGFDSVCGHIAPDVFSRTVINSLMLHFVMRGQSEVIELRFVGHNHVNGAVYVLRDEVIKFFLVKIASGNKARATSAFLESNNRDFVVNPMSASDALALAADVAFVDFDGPCKVCLSLAGLSHCSADSVAQVPSGFIRTLMLSPEGTLDLRCGHSFAGFHDEQDSGKPSIQRKVCIVEDRLRSHAKLIKAFFAFKLAVTHKFKNVLAFAAQAFNTIRPAQFYQQSAALFVGRKHLSEVAECHG